MKMYDLIFSKEYPQRIYRHILFWVVLYVFSLITYFHPYLEKSTFSKWMVVQLAEIFLHVITQMAFCYILLYSLFPRFLNKKRYTSFTVRLLLISAVTIFVYYWEHILFFKPLHHFASMPFMPPDITLWFTVISFLTYFPRSAALVLAIKILKNWYIKQRENQLLVMENASAELQLLKAQIHPHFLFNTLNNLYSFTLTKSPESSLLIKKLSATLNYMINECEAALVPLKKEVDMIQDYMQLEKIRYGNRLMMETIINGDMNNKLITPLLLVPFIENSFKHGTSQMLQQPWIKLQIDINDDQLTFQLSNSKPLVSPVAPASSGIGLNNVKKRMELLYPLNHQLSIEGGSDIFSVRMQIPIVQVSNDVNTNLTIYLTRPAEII